VSRISMIGAIALGGASLAGCTSTPAPEAPDALPFVSVTLVGLRASPLKADGACWDPFCDISSQDRQTLVAALATVHPVAALAGALTPTLLEALSKPDISGTATLLINGVEKQSFALRQWKDSFTPQWSVTWRHVPLDGSAILRVEAQDIDPELPLIDSDPVGTFVIAHGDMYSALMDGHVVQVPVHTQTNRQVLVAGIHIVTEQ
jgi:hypothetical protein